MNDKIKQYTNCAKCQMAFVCITDNFIIQELKFRNIAQLLCLSVYLVRGKFEATWENLDYKNQVITSSLFTYWRKENVNYVTKEFFKTIIQMKVLKKLNKTSNSDFISKFTLMLKWSWLPTNYKKRENILCITQARMPL